MVESDTDTVADTSTDTYSDDESGDSANGTSEQDIATSTDSLTATGYDSDPDTLTEVTSQALGVSGVNTGGSVESIDTSGKSGDGGLGGPPALVRRRRGDGRG